MSEDFDLSKVVPRGRLQKVVKRMNDLSQKVNEGSMLIVEQAIETIQDPDAEVADRNRAKKDIMDMQKLCIEGQRVQSEILKIEATRRAADKDATKNGAAFLEERITRKMSYEAALAIMEKTDNVAPAPEVLDAEPTTMQKLLNQTEMEDL